MKDGKQMRKEREQKNTMMGIRTKRRRSGNRREKREVKENESMRKNKIRNRQRNNGIVQKQQKYCVLWNFSNFER
jgi:hypothetical protein